jgi:hypothetical protein
MTDCGDGAFTPGLVVREVLGERRHGVVLHKKLAEATASLLEVIAEGDDAQAVKACLPSTTPVWVATFDEAWATVSDKIMLTVMSDCARVWSGGSPLVAQVPQGGSLDLNPATGNGSTFPPYTLAPTGTIATPPAGSDEWIASMLAGLNVSDQDVPQATEDIKFMRIPGVRVMGLALATVTGHTHPLGDSAELRWGSDIRLCEIVRKSRKAGIETLDDIVKGKKRRDVAHHFTRLAKDFSDRGLIEEATLISQFWAETSAAFEGWDTGLFEYLVEWLRRYGGRGIPKLLDTDLVLRVMTGNGRKGAGGSGDGASESDVKDLKSKLEKVSAKLNESSQAQASLLKRVTRAESKLSEGDASTKGKCFVCGGDHLARDCTQKKKQGKNGKDKAGDGSVVDLTEEE